MASLNVGKSESVKWIKEHFKKNATCLDVGPCDGKWSDLLRDYLIMDGVEIYAPNIDKHNLSAKYRNIFRADVRGFQYEYYDLIIFGDVLEHMSIEDAQKVIEYAAPRCENFLIAVPYKWVNRSHYGNPWEIHIQDDLTPENVLERYPGIKPLFVYERYGYYVKA